MLLDYAHSQSSSQSLPQSIQPNRGDWGAARDRRMFERFDVEGSAQMTGRKVFRKDLHKDASGQTIFYIILKVICFMHMQHFTIQFVR